MNKSQIKEHKKLEKKSKTLKFICEAIGKDMEKMIKLQKQIPQPAYSLGFIKLRTRFFKKNAEYNQALSNEMNFLASCGYEELTEMVGRE